MLVTPPDPPVKAAKGRNDREALHRIRETRSPGWSFEVGTPSGGSLAHSHCEAMADDPTSRSPATIGDTCAAGDRNWEKMSLRTGGIWNPVSILRAFRPDPTVRIIDARPSDLGIAAGLDPSNTVLEERDDGIVARHTDMSTLRSGKDAVARKPAPVAQDDPDLLGTAA